MRKGEAGGREVHRCCCAEGTSAVGASSIDPGLICWWDQCICLLYTHTHTHTDRLALTALPPFLALHRASFPHQHFPLLFSNIYNNHPNHPPTLSHPLPPSPAPQALNLALISLCLKSTLPPIHQSSSPFPLVSICLSLILPHSLLSFPSSPRRSYPLGLCTAARLMSGRISLLEALILWKLISRTELQIPPLGTLAFVWHGSV